MAYRGYRIDYIEDKPTVKKRFWVRSAGGSVRTPLTRTTTMDKAMEFINALIEALNES